MDYLVKTKAKNWKLNQLYSRYKEKCNNNLNAQSPLKSELSELIQSEIFLEEIRCMLLSKKLKKQISSYLQVSLVTDSVI
jgi:hypothetical protein